MNKLKKGFTIAELLLCIAIIGVVSAMGMTLTKYNVEKAYRSYWQTVFNNLYAALAQIPYDLDEFTQQNIIKTCNYAFKDINDYNSEESNQNDITASNGVSYHIDIEDGNDDIIPIIMTVPCPKTRQNENGTAKTRLWFVNAGGGILMPARPKDANEVDLRNSELLKFYIDDGTVGRHFEGQKINGSENLATRTYSKTFCYSQTTQESLENLNNLDLDNWKSLIDSEDVGGNSCNGINANKVGYIKPVTPKL